MTRAELSLQRQALHKLLDPLDAIVMCCHSCEHFIGRRCAHYDAAPPDDSVDVDLDCAEWTFDEIPF